MDKVVLILMDIHNSVEIKDGSAISCNMLQFQLQVVATPFLYNAIATAIQFSHAAAIAEPSLVEMTLKILLFILFIIMRRSAN